LQTWYYRHGITDMVCRHGIAEMTYCRDN